MRKTLAIISVLALVLVGFIAMANPVAACNGFTFTKEMELIYQEDCDGIVEVGEEAKWKVTITIKNNYPWPMTNVVVTDRLGAELEIDYICTCSPSHGSVDYITKGNSEKVFLTWKDFDLGPCQTATLCFVISTDENPAGHQEYTEEGCYQLNSGAVLKFRDQDNKQVSAHTVSWWWYVAPQDNP